MIHVLTDEVIVLVALAIIAVIALIIELVSGWFQ